MITPVSIAALPAAAEPPAATVSLGVTVDGLRTAKGVIRLAICPEGAAFPDCGAKAVRTVSLTIETQSVSARFADLAPGVYAVSVFHDANGNGRLDTFLGIPREGYGFSHNPPFRMRAPRFAEARMDLRRDAETTISLRYLL